MKSSAGLLLLLFAWNIYSQLLLLSLGGRVADSGLLMLMGGIDGLVVRPVTQHWLTQFLSTHTRILVAPKGIRGTGASSGAHVPR